MPKIANHIHKFKKVDLATSGKPYLVYKCMMPTCSHYVPINLAEGKMCACWGCGDPMIITRETLHHSSNKPAARPKCPNCIVRKNAKDVSALADFLAGDKVTTE